MEDSVKPWAILGNDFIYPYDVMRARPDVAYNNKQLAALDSSQPSVSIIKWCRDNDYAVMSAPPIECSTMDVRELNIAHFCSEESGCYDNQMFASDDKTSLGWLAIKKTPIANSVGKNWNEKIGLLSTLERVPNVAEMSWFITTYFEVRGIRLFREVRVLTSSLDSNGGHVSLGLFDAEGLNIDFWHDVNCVDSLGLSGGLKL